MRGVLGSARPCLPVRHKRASGHGPITKCEATRLPGPLSRMALPSSHRCGDGNSGPRRKGPASVGGDAGASALLRLPSMVCEGVCASAGEKEKGGGDLSESPVRVQ